VPLAAARDVAQTLDETAAARRDKVDPAVDT